MSVSGINQQVQAYDQWRKGIAKEVADYLKWLHANQLCSEEIEEQLARKLLALQNDALTVAFVGEFSRGKTELINALFFAEFGQRMLPSHAGRTTMCPAEIFYDNLNGSYVRLLPIETRGDERPLSSYKERPQDWVNKKVNTLEPDTLREALDQVARTKSVTFEQARKLGFDAGSLEPDRERPGHALIPAWRHAQISLDHPVLRQGLRILDTPGLNALGSEPELTVSMIPSAQAIIFLLGADTGVTASDMEIWSQHLMSQEVDQRSARFAVLNKIDMFWDDLCPESQTNAMIEDMRRKTAAQLGLAASEVLTLSARQALIGRIKGDQSLLQKSRIASLEEMISEKLLLKKEKLLTQDLIMDVLGMLQTSQSILQSRYDSLRERLDTLLKKGIQVDTLNELTEKTQRDHNYYYKKLFTLRSSRRLMKSQAMILERLVNTELFDKHASQTRDELVNSWTTMGMGYAIMDFFNAINGDMSNLRHEGRLAQKMVDSIYQRYNDGLSATTLKPIPFSIGRQLRELETLRRRAEKFKMGASTLLSEQTVVVKRFFNTLVVEARRLYLEISEESQRWPQDSLLPLLQHTLEQKQTLEQQIKRLRDLGTTAKDTITQQRKLEEMLEDLKRQMQSAETIQRRIRKPAPQLLLQKVVNLPGATR